MLLKLLPLPIKKLAVVALPKLALPAVTLPDAVNVFALTTLTLLILPPLVDKLATVVFPVTFNVPEMFAPVPVTIKIFALPATLVVTLPFAVTRTLLFPFTIELPALTVIPVNKLPLPVKKLAVTLLPKLALPEVMLPVTDKLVSVPTEVMFGCADVVNVPVI